jgi:L-iditol 2-dehydrogenase
LKKEGLKMIEVSATRSDPAIPATMRAAVLCGEDDFRVVEKPVPEPGVGEALVRVAMCGTCGTDLKIQTHPLPNQPPFGQFTPGHEWTGTVVALGPTVDELRVGDRVAIEAHKGCGRCENCLLGMYTACLNNGNLAKGHRASGLSTDGGFAEYVVHHVSSLYRLPDGLGWEDAVVATTAGTGLYGLDTVGGLIAGSSVVVCGPGPVGLTTVQACKALGADPVVLLGTRQARLEIGRRCGADHVFNVRSEGLVERVRELTGGQGADLTIEASGGPGAPQQLLEMTKRGGRMLALAYYSDPVTFDLSAAVRDDITIYATRGEGRRSVQRAISLAAQGKMRLGELVSHRFPLSEIGEAMRALRTREGDPVKIVIVPGQREGAAGEGPGGGPAWGADAPPREGA